MCSFRNMSEVPKILVGVQGRYSCCRHIMLW